MFTFNPGMPPTRRCVVCRRLEIPESGTLIRALWFCPECTQQIRQQLIKEVKDNEVDLATENP